MEARMDTGEGDGPELQYRRIHGYRRAFRMAGEGPPLLLLHGISDNSETWLPVMDALARRHTVIAPDLLGHGSSDKPRADYSVAAFSNGVRDLLDVLGVEQATVVGHSLGGGVAAQFAYQYPERVERLALVSSGGVAREVSAVLRLAAAPLSEFALWPFRLPGAGLAQRLGTEVLRRSGHDLGRDADDLQRVLSRLPDAAARGAFTRTLRAVVDWRGQLVTMLDRCYLAETMPVLIIWGDHDGVIPVHHAHVAHAAMPTSELVIFDGAGHFPHHSDPDRFVAELRRFVRSTRPFVHDLDRRRELLRSGRPDRDEPAVPALLG
jgi:pimeloyl-ACP methyl ester carboxylesterase